MASRAATKSGPRKGPRRPAARLEEMAQSGLGRGSVRDKLDQLRRGLPYQSLGRLQRTTGLTQEQITAAARIPARTLSRRKASGQFSFEESERLSRVLRVHRLAVALFEGDGDGATRWMTSPKRALEGLRPIDLLFSEAGAWEVEAMIGRLEHGVFM